MAERPDRADGDVLQALAGEMLGFFEFVNEALAREPGAGAPSVVEQALRQDLGLAPARRGGRAGGTAFPADGIEAVRAYRDAANPQGRGRHPGDRRHRGLPRRAGRHDQVVLPRGRVRGWPGPPAARPLGHRHPRRQLCPNAVIYATRAGPPPEERQPIFTGGFAPDVRYFGFDIPAAEIAGWSIVLQEHPSAPRFGIEVGDDTGGRTHLAPPGAPGTNATLVARQTRQMPVRITLPSSVLLGTG